MTARDHKPAFTARLTIDITPELRGRIKITAFRRGLMVVEMLRDPRADFLEADGVGSDE